MFRLLDSSSSSSSSSRSFVKHKLPTLASVALPCVLDEKGMPLRTHQWSYVLDQADNFLKNTKATEFFTNSKLISKIYTYPRWSLLVAHILYTLLGGNITSEDNPHAFPNCPLISFWPDIESQLPLRYLKEFDKLIAYLQLYDQLTERQLNFILNHLQHIPEQLKAWEHLDATDGSSFKDSIIRTAGTSDVRQTLTQYLAANDDFPKIATTMRFLCSLDDWSDDVLDLTENCHSFENLPSQYQDRLAAVFTMCKANTRTFRISETARAWLLGNYEHIHLETVAEGLCSLAYILPYNDYHGRNMPRCTLENIQEFWNKEVSPETLLLMHPAEAKSLGIIINSLAQACLREEGTEKDFSKWWNRIMPEDTSEGETTLSHLEGIAELLAVIPGNVIRSSTAEEINSILKEPRAYIAQYQIPHAISKLACEIGKFDFVLDTDTQILINYYSDLITRYPNELTLLLSLSSNRNSAIIYYFLRDSLKELLETRRESLPHVVDICNNYIMPTCPSFSSRLDDFTELSEKQISAMTILRLLFSITERRTLQRLEACLQQLQQQHLSVEKIIFNEEIINRLIQDPLYIVKYIYELGGETLDTPSPFINNVQSAQNFVVALSGSLESKAPLDSKTSLNIKKLPLTIQDYIVQTLCGPLGLGFFRHAQSRTTNLREEVKARAAALLQDSDELVITTQASKKMRRT